MYIIRLEHNDLTNLITHLALATERARDAARIAPEHSELRDHAWNRVADLERLLDAADDADGLDDDGVAKLDSIIGDAFAAWVEYEKRRFD